jgi:pimeloyl-ACP methyl ester carboxylesterase
MSMTNIATPDRTIDLPDGRTIAVDERGPAGGPVVVLCHVAPGSRRFDPDPAATEAAGIRLITVDRAGYGGSTALPEGAVPSVAGHADDLAAALDELGVRDAAVAGWSAGGRVALALAARRPDLARAVAVVATPAHDDDVSWIPEEFKTMIQALRADPAKAVDQVAAALAGQAADPAAAIAAVSSGPADAEILAADPERRSRLEAMLAEAFRQGAIGAAADIVSYTMVPWGFDPAAVAAPTTFFYGDADPIVTPTHGEWYASRIPGSSLRVVPGGHLIVQTAWAEVVAAIA